MRRGCTVLALVAALGFGATLASAQTPPTALDQAVKAEADDALPMTDFYATPANLGASHPGDLLRQETFDGYALPAGVRAVRILYHSLSAEGRGVAASAVVLIPPGPAPAGGWPVIVWAHGTSGVARQCAPSLMKDVYYGEEGLFPMLRAGYAVVAPDYAGLGTEGEHQYVAKTAQAQDVIFAVPAARAAAAALGSRWVVDGHSQGGLAAWGVAELETQRHDPGYLGAVAVAPPSHLDEILPADRGGAAASFYIEYMAEALHALTPSFAAADVLQGVALDRYADVTTKGCFAYAYAAFQNDQAAPELKPGWNTTPAARRFFDQARIGEAPIAGPLLVVAGEADQTVPLWAVRATAVSACGHGIGLTLRTYPGLDHDPVMEKSTPDQLAWIADRFAGRPAPAACDAATTRAPPTVLFSADFEDGSMAAWQTGGEGDVSVTAYRGNHSLHLTGIAWATAGVDVAGHASVTIRAAFAGYRLGPHDLCVAEYSLDAGKTWRPAASLRPGMDDGVTLHRGSAAGVKLSGASQLTLRLRAQLSTPDAACWADNIAVEAER